MKIEELSQIAYDALECEGLVMRRDMNSVALAVATAVLEEAARIIAAEDLNDAEACADTCRSLLQSLTVEKGTR